MFFFLHQTPTIRIRNMLQTPVYTHLFNSIYPTTKQHNYTRPFHDDVEKSNLFDVKIAHKNANRCMICFDADLFGCQLHYTSCSHNYCKPCLSTHYKTKILDGEVLNLTCVDPKCDRKISDKEICQLINDVEIEKKFYKFKKQALLRMDKNVIFCCKPDCDGYIYNNKRFYHLCSKLQCNDCQTRMCWKCHQPFHGFILGCNQLMDMQYYKWALLRDVQKCPNCNSKIEKTGGCNHMSCSSCKYQFCWICRGHYEYGHYNWSIKNVFGCPGVQYTYKFIRFPSWTPVWVNRIILTVCLIPVLLVTAILGLLCGCASRIKYKWKYGSKSAQGFIVSGLMLMFFVSLAGFLHWMRVIDIWAWIWP